MIQVNKHTSETACFLARFARLGGRGGSWGWEVPTVGEEGVGTRKVGVPAARRPASSISGRPAGQGVNQGTPRRRRRPPPARPGGEGGLTGGADGRTATRGGLTAGQVPETPQPSS